MSKRIDFSQPLSEEDEVWASQFHGLHGGMIAANREQFPAEQREAPSQLSGDEPDDTPYSEWSKRDLESETKRRNNEEGASLKTTGTVAELAAQLEADDVARG
jgi:hypothetical protein